MKKITKMLRGGIILLSMMLPLCMWAATDYSKYTHVPGNYIGLNNSSTTHSNGCRYEEANNNVGNIKDGGYSTYHIYVDKSGNYELSMEITRHNAGTSFTLTITDETSSTKEFENTFEIPNVTNYTKCTFELGTLSTGPKEVKLQGNYPNVPEGSSGYIMNYRNVTFKVIYPVLLKWDFNDAENGYVQKEGTKSPFLTYYPAEGSYAYGNQTMFTLSTGGQDGKGLNGAAIEADSWKSGVKALKLSEGYSDKSAHGSVTDETITNGGDYHILYFEISVPTIGLESARLTASIGHNKSKHYMYAVYSVDGGATWTGTEKVNLQENDYAPISIDLPGGQDNVLVRLHPSGNYYYWLQTCVVSGERTQSYKVTTNGKGWASFSAVQPVSVPAGLKAYAATDINNDYVMLKELTTVAAEEGVFVKGAANTEYTLNVVDGEVTKEATNLIKPILLASAGHTVENTETIYALATKEGRCGLYRVQPDVTVKGKAYLDATGKSITKAPMFYELGDGAATGIVEVRAATVQNQTNTCYNVLGQRVAKNVKGIVLVNGKKMLNK